MDPNTIPDKNSYDFSYINQASGITKGFSLRIGSRIDIVYRLLRTVSRLTDYINLTIDDDSFFARIMDTQHVTLIDFHLQKVIFESFAISDPPVNFSFNVFNMLTILSRGIKTAKRVELMTENIGKNELIITFEGKNKAEYTIECEPSEGNYPDLPKINYKASLRVTSKMLKDILEDLRIVSDEINVTAEDNCFVFSSKNDKRSAICKLENDSPQVYNMFNEGRVSSRFNSSYIIDFIDSLKPNIVNLELGDNSPLKITEILNSGSYELGYISFYLAPLSLYDSST
jgi:DNA polymerase III sliding clamp (beta) subunit (PCNA family)